MKIRKKNKSRLGIIGLLWSVMSRRNKVEFWFLFALGIISSVAILIPTQVLSMIISKLSGESIFILGLKIPDGIDYFTIIIVGGVITYLMRLLRMSYTLNMEKLVKRVVANLRVESYEWLVVPRKNMDLKMTQGDALYRMNQGPETITSVVTNLFNSVVPEVLSAIIAFAYICMLDIQTVPIILVGMALVCLCVIVRSVIDRKITVRTEKCKSNISNNIANSIQNIPLITLYKSMAHEQKIYDKKVDKFYDEQKKQINVRWFYWAAVRMVEVLCTFTIIFLCAHRIYMGTLLVGNIIIIVNYVSQIFTPVQTVGYFSTNWLQCGVAVNRLYDLKPSAGQLLPTNTSFTDKIYSLELRNVCVENGHLFRIDNINMKFEKGQMTVIYGESGCGKSTLIKVLCGLCEKTSGDIIVNGDKPLPSAYLMSNGMSVAMQSAYIFNRDTKLNVLYPDGELSNNTDTVIHLLSMEKLFKRTFDENGEQNLENTLSGGEKKRIGISRALLRKADIYIFDEPTNELDNKNANNVIETIRSLREDAIVIVVSHDDRIIKKADQLILFNNKKMIQEDLDPQVAPTIVQEPDNKENNVN